MENKITNKSIRSSSLIISITVIFIIFIPEAGCQVALVREKLRNELISRSVNDTEITGMISSLGIDGSWSDVDYANKSRTSWIPVIHSRRLVQMATAYNRRDSRFYHDTELMKKITLAMDFYIARKPVSDNWWYNAIGAPTNFGPLLVLLATGDSYGLSQPALDHYAVNLLKYFPESREVWPNAVTGANKIWLLNSSIHKACVMNNETMLRSDFASAFEEARIMSGKAEGIKADNSFYQHGAQLYISGYGLSFLNDITYFGAIAAGTEYAMTSDQLRVITNAVLDGYRWFSHRGSFDFATAGREISRPNAGTTNSMKTIIGRLKKMNAPRQDELDLYLGFIGSKNAFTDPGNRHFWKSDIMVQHGPGFYLSARVPSKRTIGTERMNNENLLRKWLPWGSTCIMITGEEYRNIFPVWDWSRIPGTTSYLEDVKMAQVTGDAYLVSSADFAGGVSDGTYGFAAYDYSWDGIRAKKAWFFSPESVLCFGTGIESARDKPVITSVNQCLTSGSVSVFMSGRESELRLTALRTDEMKWAYHNQTGYIFPSGGKIVLQESEQTGSWYDINLSQSNSPVTKRVFSIWFEHGTRLTEGAYEYTVVPSVSISQLRRFVRENRSSVVVWSENGIQAAYNPAGRVYGLAFYRPGSVELRKGLKVGSDKPCLLLIQEEEGGGYKITAADPTQLQEVIKISVSEKLNGRGARLSDEGTTVISIDLPSGDLAGKSVSDSYLSGK